VPALFFILLSFDRLDFDICNQGGMSRQGSDGIRQMILSL
jgi:hypothetical protein